MLTDWDQAKRAVAEAALAYVVDPEAVLGVGTGSTVNAFIDVLAAHPGRVRRAVASSPMTAARLKAAGIEVVDLNSVFSLSLYIDGADEVDAFGYCLKGGGGAHTLEKVVAQASERFVAVVDERKWVGRLGRQAPVVLEVLPEARAWVGRACLALGGQPTYRVGQVSPHGHVYLDVMGLPLDEPLALEATLNGWAGVVGHGLFATQRAHTILMASANGEVKAVEAKGVKTCV